MTTAPPPMRPIQGSGPRPGPSPSGGGATAALDPVKLLKQYYPYLILALMVGTGIGVGLHFLLLRTSPSYTSMVVFECMGSREGGSVAARREPGRDEQERFQGTQVQIMTSRNIMDRALNDREVVRTSWAAPFVQDKVLNKDMAMRQLERDVTARPLPQSNLIRLSVSTRVPEDAAILANAVATEYINDHRRTGTKGTADQERVLRDLVKKFDDDIKRMKMERETALRDAKMDAPSGGSSSADLELSDVTTKLNELKASIEMVAAQQRDNQERLKNQRVDNYRDDLREEAMQDHVVRGFDQKLASLRDDLGALRKQGVLEKHEDIVRINAQIAETESQRQNRIDTVLKEKWASQVAQLDMTKQSLEAQYNKFQARKLELDDIRRETVQAQTRVRALDAEIGIATDEQAKTQRSLQEIVLLGSRENMNSEAIGDRVRIISPAVIPTAVSFPRLTVIVPVCAILATGLMGGFLFLRELLDQRVRGPSDAAMVPRVKVLGVVPDASEDPSKPKSIETVFRDNPSGVLTESYRQMRAPLIQAMERSGHKSLVVVGAMPGSGATSVATNLALAVAGADERVLVIDANFRRPAMHRVFKLSEGPGLGDILGGSASLDQAIQGTSNDYLKVITAGSASGRAVPERLAGEAMSRLLLEASSRFDMIIVDVPPAVVSGDGYAMANKCDASIIVCRAMVEKRGLLARVRNQIGESRAEFLGVVVNAVRASAGGYFKKNIKATHAYQSNGKD